MDKIARRLFLNRWFHLFSAIAAALLIAALGVCWNFRIWSYGDFRAYMEVREYPVGPDLWFGRVQAGQSLEAFVAMHPPHRTYHIGRFTILSYYSVWPTPPGSIQMESVSLTATDGKLIHAAGGGCTWTKFFFKMSARDEAELDECFERHWQQIRKEFPPANVAAPEGQDPGK